jgi:hypothetical protein
MVMTCERSSACAMMDDAGTPVHMSIHERGASEALRHKWIESEKAGRDLGDQAIRQWIARHWHSFLRERWIEHLEGCLFWAEFDPDDFGLLQHEFLDSKVRDEILRRIKSGGENLDILCWSHERKLGRDERWDVLRILERLDINSRRLECRL